MPYKAANLAGGAGGDAYGRSSILTAASTCRRSTQGDARDRHPARAWDPARGAVRARARWKDHFDRAIAAAQQQGQSEITVGDLRRWTDIPEPLGLPRDLQSLVILVYAAQSGRVFRQHGGPAQPTFEKLDDDLELVSPQLPSAGGLEHRSSSGRRNSRHR